MRFRLTSSLLFLSALAIAGASSCGGDDPLPSGPSGSGTTTSATGAGGGGGAGGAGGAGGGNTAGCEAPTPVKCSDQTIQSLDLKNTQAPGEITNEADGSGWLSTIDATAGGAFPPKDAYVYGRFTDKGLEKVAISDEDALDSMDWDIAFRRYIIRVNGGDSGPSCVEVGRIPGDVDYDGLAAPPDGLQYKSDNFFSDPNPDMPDSGCQFIPDGSGLENSPATALSSFWSYSMQNCLQMSGNVFIIELKDAKRLKFTVTTYYETVEAQDLCNTTGSSNMAKGATIRARWAFLP